MYGELVKPPKLQPGDRVATVSLSWGGPGTFPHRYAAGKRQLHWQRVAESACEQSGRISPPRVDEPMPLNDWLGTPRDGSSTDLVLSPVAGQPLTSIGKPDDGLCLLIGPEGGFSEREYDDAGLAGFEAVTLGPRILRTETAAVAAIAIAQGLWGDL